MASNPKWVRLPDRGRLLCAADLRGNLRDFLAMATRFEADPKACLLFLGNVIHGPYLLASEWKPELGSYYRDDSPAILLKLSLLREKYPGRVFTLLGNHEYAHLGGPHTSKFADDETAALEARLGTEAAAYVADFVRTWPLWALSDAGLLFSHAAPAADLPDLDALSALSYGDPGDDDLPPGDDDEESEARMRLLGQLLWSAALPPARARRAAAMAGARVLVYGHDVVSGHETIGSEQLILGTSFGLPDEEKRYLSIDLGARYESAADLKDGSEILPLYPFPGPPGPAGPISGS